MWIKWSEHIKLHPTNLWVDTSVGAVLGFFCELLGTVLRGVV
jgi:hypothetical protein